MTTRVSTGLVSVALCFMGAATTATPSSGDPSGAEEIINRYVERSFAADLDGTLALFANSPDTYFHVNGIYYFTVDAEQAVFQAADAKNYGDGWTAVRQGFADYFAGLVQAWSVRTVVRTEGQGLRAPLDGGDKLQGETAYVILAKFYLDAEGHTGYGIVHGLDQFRIAHHLIANVNNLEKTVFLTAAESDLLDGLPSDAARIEWARHRTCELQASVFATSDLEKRFDLGLACP